MPLGHLWLPDWAPNLHPVLVHFPIALLVMAVALDLMAVLSPQAFTRRATGIYLLGSILLLLTYISGRDAGATVFTPGMAHGLVQEHWDWAMWTTIYFWGLSLGRVLVRARLSSGHRLLRAAFLIAGSCGVALLTMTAERGARLVYEYGVGVVGSP